MSEKNLHYERVAPAGVTPQRWLYVLHGIFGAGRNWATVARRVVRERPDWGAVLVDLREHGASGSFPPPNTIEAAARDVARLADHIATKTDAVLGHSFGGKVALMYGRLFPDAVRQLWIVDSTPDAGRPEGTAAQILEIVRRRPGPFASRDEAVHALVTEGVAPPVAQWMATNVVPVDGEYRWRLDFEALDALLRDFYRTDLWDVVDDPPPGVEIDFVRAEGSSILTPQACERIEAAGRRTGRVFLRRVKGGHWVNAENPDAVVALLRDGLIRGDVEG